MKKTNDLSIIIVSYNTRDLTRKCLQTLYESLEASSIVFEVVIVDNHSLDGSCELIEKEFPKALLIKNSENIGFGAANNLAIQKSKGETLLLLNSDTEILDQAIEKLFLFYRSLPEKSIVGAKLLNPDMSPQPSCGPSYTLLAIFVALFLKGDYLNITRYSPRYVKEVDWVMGACIMVNRDAFSDVGLFDKDIFMYMEEIDWEYRAKKQGYRVWFYPDARIIHVGAGSSKGRENPILNVFSGFTFFYKKHYSYISNVLLRVILILKSVAAICLFTIMNKKYDQNIYKKALKSLI